MAIEEYYASTARNAKDLAQYLVYPLFKTLALMHCHDGYKANVIAGTATTMFYTGLAWTFFGLESDSFDQNVRAAVAAEMGKKPEELKFSDFFDSKNSLVKSRMGLFNLEQQYRYPLSLAPMLPAIMERTAGARLKQPPRHPDDTIRTRPSAHASPMEHFLYGHNMWDHAVYAAVAGMWLGETYFIDKSGAYEVQKVKENDESVSHKISANELIGIYNRVRSDTGKAMIEDKIDREKLWPVLTKIAEKVNSLPDFNMPEVVYLMGMGHLDIFAKDAKGNEIRNQDGHLVVDQDALKSADEAIEHIAKAGLKGIGEENRKKREAGQLCNASTECTPSFVQRLNRNWIDTQFNAFQNLVGKQRKQVEHISPRDLGDTPLSMA